MSETTKKRPRFSRVGRWLAELVLVFVSVYVVFWLNNYQQHQQEIKRRDQILASLEQEFRREIESGRIAAAKLWTLLSHSLTTSTEPKTSCLTKFRLNENGVS
jgi:hypothetical protein